MGICDALLCVSHTLQSALENGQEGRIVQINFNATFDRVNHQGILRFLGDAFGFLSWPFWSTVLQCGARLPITHLKLLDRAVSGARFLTGVVFECDIAHCRFVAVLCMLYKIRSNPVHPLHCALPGPCVPVRITRGALVAHRCTYAPPLCEPRSTE